MTDRHEINFDRVAHEYEETRGGTVRAQAAARDLAPHLPPGRALEIGVGTGIVGQAVLHEAPAVTEIVGVDISAEMLRLATPRLPGRLVRGAAQRLPFAAGTFDAMVAVHILHLVPDLGATLREAARVLRPGGRLVAVHGTPRHANDDEFAAATRSMVALRAARSDAPDAVRTAASAAGLHCHSQQDGSPRTSRHTPAELAELLVSRTWSSLWDLDDDQWRTHVQPAVDALRALPDQHRVRTQSSRTTVTVLERPRAH